MSAINPTNWMLSNLDPTKVRIERNTANELISRGTTANAEALIMRNSIISKKGAIAGTFGFTACSIYPMAAINHSFGLYIDADNRIEFYRKNSANYNLSFRIVSGAVTIYEVDDVAKDFGKYEIRVTAENVISAYIYNGKSWTQIGVDQTVDWETKYIFAASCGGTISKLSLSYCYIKL